MIEIGKLNKDDIFRFDGDSTKYVYDSTRHFQSMYFPLSGDKHSTRPLFIHCTTEVVVIK